MKRIFFLLLFFILISCRTGYCISETITKGDTGPGQKRKNFTLFESDEILNVSLRLDLRNYLKKDFKAPLVAEMTFHVSETDSISEDVKVSNRGTFRSSYCKYPPLEISFSKAMNAYSGFGKFKRIKLYTCCESGAKYDEYVLREFLVYKLYNTLTDTSFRVRLVQLRFEDSEKKRKPIIQFAFFLEPKEIVCERIDLKLVKIARLGQSSIVPDVMDRIAIFNYLISNYDWSVAGQHNVTVFQPLKNSVSGLGIAIPHDFDGTGVVNADYAIPTAETGLKSIRERLFLGTCRSKMVFQQELRNFLSKKQDIYGVITGFPYLNQRSKKDIIDFLDQFFNQIEKQKSLDNLIGTFMENCKKT